MSATPKRTGRSINQASYELVRATLLDPDTTVTVEPFDPSAWPYFETASMVLADPFDAAIVATARALQLPLVTRDAAITSASVADDVIW